MFTFYAEIPTKNLIIEVPAFSEDHEAFSTYSPAEIDASFDFQFVAYQPSSEFQLIGQAVCEAPDSVSAQDIETPYSYAPIYAEEPELINKVSEFEETTRTQSSFEVEFSTVQQDTSIDPSYRYNGEFRKNKDTEKPRKSTDRSSETSECEISSQYSKKGRIHKLFSEDQHVLNKRSHLGLHFNQPSLDSASHKNKTAPFKGSQVGRALSIFGFEEKEQQPINISDRSNLKPIEQQDLENFTDSDLSSSSKPKLSPTNSNSLRECLKREREVTPFGNCGIKNKEEGNTLGFEVKTTKKTDIKNVHRVNIAPYEYQLLQKQDHYRQRPLDRYHCFIPHHQVLATEHPLLCIDNNLRFNLSKAVAPAYLPSKEGVALDPSFFDHNSC